MPPPTVCKLFVCRYLPYETQCTVPRASSLVSRARSSRPSRRHPRADSRQGERRHHHQDRARAAADRGAAAARSQLPARLATPSCRRRSPRSRPTSIVDAVDELLLVQRGRELGYTLGNEQFRNIVENIKKENKLETEEQFQAALKQEGMTLEDLRKQLERKMLVSRVQQVEVMGKISVTEDEVEEVLRGEQGHLHARSRSSRCARFWSPCRRATRASTSPKTTPRRRRPRICASASSGGEPFAQLASESSDSASKANGGLIGPISRDRPVAGAAEGNRRAASRAR